MMFNVQTEITSKPGNQKVESIKSAFVPCTVQTNGRRFFPLLSDKEFKNYLDNNYTYCLNSTQVSFRNNLQSIYENQVVNFVVKYCDSRLLSMGKKCQTKLAVDSIIKSKGLYLQLLLPTTYADS